MQLMRVPRTPLKVWFWISPWTDVLLYTTRASLFCKMISRLLNAEDDQTMCKQFPLFLLRLTSTAWCELGVAWYFRVTYNWMFKCALWVYIGTTGYSYDSSQQLLIKFVLSGKQDNVEIRILSVLIKAGVSHFVWVLKSNDYRTPIK